MRILRTKTELREWRRALPPGERVGLVPTMGALHVGHLSLVRQSRERCARTIVSIFVNPLQFGPNEDYERYPRDFTRDCELLKAAGCDAVFAPTADELYAANSSTYVVEEQVSLPLCGKQRTGHFRGVATVVLKLFNLVAPDAAFFGQKDGQQCAVIERLVRDLDVAVEIVRGETVREDDGLALSSRNAYLSADERKKAALLRRALQAVVRAHADGERDARRLETLGRAILENEAAFQVQYFEARHPATLERLERVGTGGALVAVAAQLGKTRLIDNVLLS